MHRLRKMHRLKGPPWGKDSLNPKETTLYEREKITARMKQLSDLMKMVQENEVYDPHSYIVFDPKNIRSSISAEYNPEQSENPDITKAQGGFVDKPLYDRDRSYYG